MDSGFRDSAHDTSTMSGTPYTFDDDLSLSHTNPRLSPGTSFGAPDSMSSYTLDTSRLTAEQVETIFWQAQSIPNQSIRSGYQAVVSPEILARREWFSFCVHHLILVFFF